jgi:hypothetical protein
MEVDTNQSILRTLATDIDRATTSVDPAKRKLSPVTRLATTLVLYCTVLYSTRDRVESRGGDNNCRKGSLTYDRFGHNILSQKGAGAKELLYWASCHDE